MTDLSSEPFLLLGKGYDLRRVTIDACRQTGFTPRVVLEGGELDTVLTLAASGLGVAVVPARYSTLSPVLNLEPCIVLY